ncbi:hypothetical protein [Flavobacterium nitratireducens]|nr:hypothetical protein [Flavobacterium nitratireducens]
MMLLAVKKKSIFGEYKHPLWLTITGWFVVAIMSYMSITTLIEQLA